MTLLVASAALEMFFGYREAKQHITQTQRLQAQGMVREIEQYLRFIEDSLADTTKFPWGSPGWDMDARRQEWHRLLVESPRVSRRPVGLSQTVAA
ncbi:hypothetical protein [Roseateles puraquae]|uniref:Uncharacterized protein n=1 Tax=Roseateles puraquae TaxID=431059 RepID=A0A254N8I5_9BURK|nr:hypothetical protein [Roseateles puraquae]MDG0855254.1 hypothetical protein [Roseateles puraquae]MDG0855331.1 hypothetical protein [Roseateles puraquae]OWR01758.1 hypothetical protein CDO81_23630 [Roseateles puraquae]